MGELRFDGQVAIVTGAGRGIGRAHAQLLAARGARVAVNDVGVAMNGAGGDPALARESADAIIAAGGEAIVDGSDISTVEGAERLVESTLAEFGRVDILINNAGIFGLDTFPDMTFEDMQRQLAVHVGGSFHLARACWPHMRSAKYGRIVMTTSTGALGSEMLTAYGTAKAGVFGLARALACAAVASEVDIKVNAVAPMAATRMAVLTTDGADPPPDPDRDPKLVSPLVAVLAHESCPVNGETLMGGIRRYSRLFIGESAGYVHPTLDVTPETITEHWAEITDISDAEPQTDMVSWIARNTDKIDLVPRQA